MKLSAFKPLGSVTVKQPETTYGVSTARDPKGLRRRAEERL